MALVISAFVSVCVACPCAWLLRRRRGGELASSQGKLARIAWQWTCVTCTANLLAIGAVMVTLSRVARPSVAVEFQTGLPQSLTALMGVGTVFAVLSLGAPVFAALAWIKRYWSFWARTYFSLLALACLVYVWFCNFWNLIGFRD
jgi:hypothetical protein